MAPYITLPLKGMTDADWSAPLRIYFSSTYGSLDNYINDINQLNRLRLNARGASTDQNGRAIIVGYYKQLEVLDLRVPVNDVGCRINFTWQDASSKAPTTQHSLAYEKASLLFNIAAISSHIATDADDLRITYKYFQEAAGAFQFIFDKFLHAPSTDLTQETVKALCKLMLAQAQEAAVETRLANESSKPQMSAKLAKAANKLYASASSLLKDIFDEKGWGQKVWHQYASIKASYYLAVARSQQSLACEQKDKYGEAIAYLMLAKSGLQELVAVPVPPQFSKFSDSITNLGKHISERLVVLEKDNDFIYHDDIPDSSALADISAVEAAAPKPITDIVGQEEFKSLFSNVYSMATHQANSLYSEEKAKLLRAQDEKMDIADKKLASGLEFLEFPKALSEMKSLLYPSNSADAYSESSLDPILNDWAKQVSCAPPVSKSVSGLEALRFSVYNIIKDAENLLKSEENDYNEYKSQYKDRWTQASSSLMASGLWGDASRIKHDLAQGTNDDNVLIRNVSEYQKELEILAAGPSNPKLLAAFRDADKAEGPSQTAPSLLDIDTTPNTSVFSDVKECETIVSTIHKLQKERNATFADFKMTVHDDDISTVLTLNKNQPGFSEETLFKEELKKFDPYISRLDQMVERESELIKRVTVVWSQILQDPMVQSRRKSQKDMSTRRAALFEQFQTAFLGWTSFNKRSVAGMTYYRNLEKNATVLKTNATELVANRREEAAKLKETVQGGSAQSSQDMLKEQLARMEITARPAAQYYPPAASSYSDVQGYTPRESLSSAPPSAQWDFSVLEKPALPVKPQGYGGLPYQNQAFGGYQSNQSYGGYQQGQPQPNQQNQYGQQPQYGQSQPNQQNQQNQYGQQPQYGQPQPNQQNQQNQQNQYGQPPQPQYGHHPQYSQPPPRPKDYSSLPPPPPPPSGYY